MMNMNEELMKSFALTIPKLERDEVYLMVAGARKKYAKDNPDVSTSHEVMIRHVVRDTEPDKFMQGFAKTVSQLAFCRDKNTGKFFPQESWVVWITANPRSTVKALFNFNKKNNDLAYDYVNAKNDHQKEVAHEKFKKSHIRYYSALQVAQSRRLNDIIDIDVKDMSLLKDVHGYLEPYVNMVTETRGGYHILYKPEGNRIIYEEKLREKLPKTVEIKKDTLTHIWGAKQGGFLVRPVDL